MAKAAESKYLISYKNLQTKLEKEPVPGIILLSLNEKILLDDLLKIICRKFGGNDFDEKNNLLSFNGEDRVIETILNECSNTGLFSDRKIIVVRNVKKLLKDEKLALADYFKRPNPDTCLIMVSSDAEFNPGKIFLYDSKSENERAKDIQKAVESSVKIYEISGFSEKDFVLWVKEKFDDYKISETAVNQLILYSNYSFDEILQEIEKLKTYCFKTKEITTEAVNLCNGIAKDFNETDFIRALMERDNEKALKIYERISLKKDIEVYLIFLLSSAFVIINKLYDPAISKYQGWQLKSELKLWFADQEILLPYYQRYRNSVSADKITDTFNNIYLSDKLLKTSGREKKTVMISLINSICKN